MAMCGEVIDEEEKIKIQPPEHYYRLFYNEQMEGIFDTAPKYRDTSDMTGLARYKYGLGKYLQELYRVYRDILMTDTALDFFDLDPLFPDRRTLMRDSALAKRFLAAIKIKRLRMGSRVDRYLEGFTYQSEYLTRLLREYKGHYILANNDTNHLDYKLALISSFSFCTRDGKELFEWKVRAWERKRAAKP